MKFVLLALALAVGSAAAQPVKAPYVPTPQVVVDTMLDLARVGPRDFVIDLGSGDGRIVTTAARRHGARGLGIELDANLVRFARQYAREQGVGARVRFERADLFKTDLRPASVVTLYLLPEMLLTLRPKFLTALAPGTRIVAHDFDLGDWRPDEHLSIPVPGKPVGPAPQSEIFLWIVPADVAGEWAGEFGGRRLRFAIEQRFQEIGVQAWLDGAPVPTRAARLRGTDLAFELESSPHVALTATVGGSALAGVATIEGRPLQWTARHSRRPRQ